MKDTGLLPLHTDKRWSDAVDHIRLNLLELSGKIDKGLQDTLNRVYTDDQGQRLKVDSIQQAYGWKSRQVDSLWRLINKTDPRRSQCE